MHHPGELTAGRPALHSRLQGERGFVTRVNNLLAILKNAGQQQILTGRLSRAQEMDTHMDNQEQVNPLDQALQQWTRDAEPRAGTTPGWFLEYQPQVALPSKVMVGVEALVRWKLPNGDVLGPDQFIPWLEGNGWVACLGDWVLRHACQQWQIWNQNSMWPRMRMSVNVSAYQLRDPNFSARTLTLLEDLAVDPAILELELTEGTAWNNFGQVVAAVNEFRACGVRVVMDDFGQGVSGLNALRMLPLDGIKIDRAFIAGIDTDQKRQLIVASATNLGHQLGLTVTAEGVETAAEWLTLTDLHCDAAQGYYISWPLSAKHFTYHGDATHGEERKSS